MSAAMRMANGRTARSPWTKSGMPAARFAISKAMVAHRAQPRCRDSPIPAAIRAMARASKNRGPASPCAELMLRACLDAPEPVGEPSGPEQGVAAGSCECGSGDDHHGDDADVEVQDLPRHDEPFLPAGEPGICLF
jgi:hypothetical protein